MGYLKNPPNPQSGYAPPPGMQQPPNICPPPGGRGYGQQYPPQVCESETP